MHLRDIVISIPHASTHIPPHVRSRMVINDEMLHHEPDLYTDKIYAVSGTRIVKAEFSRVISDVNRAPDEIYTEGSARAQSVVMLSQSHGQDIYAEDPDMETMQEWVTTFHAPFHAALGSAMEGASFLIDGHSMWSKGPPSSDAPGVERADIVLGNRQYSSCSAEATKFFRSAFENLGYRVSVNIPFAGRYIIGTYANRFRTPGIQIEVNRKLYLNEESLEPDEIAIARLAAEMTQTVQEFCDWSTQHPVKKMTDLSHRD